MKPNFLSSRRRFVGAAGIGAASAVLRPVFSRNTLLAAPPFPESDGFIHLGFNENPYGPSEKALRAIRDSIGAARRYPADLTYEGLKTRLGKHHGLPAGNVVVGTGSTEILKICDDVFLPPKPRLVIAEPTYDAVYYYATNSRAEAATVPLTRDYRHDLQKMADAITPQTGLVLICNPNNPTGTIVTRNELERFMDRIPDSVTVLVDEAYSHFAGRDFESAVRYVKEGRNVVVARTFSKAYGLAGMRIGYAVAPEYLVSRMRPHGLDFNLSVPAVAAAEAALADSSYIDRVVRWNEAQREAFYAEMRSGGFEYIPSQANFVMVNIRRSVAGVIDEFWERKILVGRPFPLMTTFLRVSLGTAEEMKTFFAAFRSIMKRR